MALLIGLSLAILVSSVAGDVVLRAEKEPLSAQAAGSIDLLASRVLREEHPELQRLKVESTVNPSHEKQVQQAAAEKDAGEVRKVQLPESLPDEEPLIIEDAQVRRETSPNVAQSMNALIMIGGLVALAFLGREFAASVKKPGKKDF
eukprot:gnl/MRDRNA2_/MRDRNA2_118064_c0_seq1.p2 gnl/MRDRNA2_/MRDRNA2_118064_c0~~gnl/MRDRNA2_/MRDRNA2_118064_c0_seq1.p2  ORF type:complete len:147 (+),score=35.41 gnl/MRDRNA2_/MRDRNA2_118064_c0_seq1:80-520(+)